MQETEADREAREFKKRFDRRRRIFRLCFLLIIIAIVSLFVAKSVREHRTIGGIPKPIQKDLSINDEKGHSFEVEDGTVELTYLATYDIEGLVVFVDDYDDLWSNLFKTTPSGQEVAERAMPRDISLAWGNVAANANDFKWSHGYRDLVMEYKGGVSVRDSEGDFEMSNNHIIIEPNSDLRKDLMKVKKRDHIRMKGYLVQGIFTNTKTGYAEMFTSSLSRSDSGGGGFNRKTNCEIMYLTDLEWLD